MTAANLVSYPTRLSKTPGSSPTPDSTALFGQIGRIETLKVRGEKDIAAVAIGSSTTPVLTVAQFIASLWDISGAPGGAWTLTTPTAAQIISGLPTTIPADGYFNFDFDFMNDDTGQTATLTAASGVTIKGTATVAANYNRSYRCNVNVGAGTVTIINLGVKQL